jgi:glycosyltransferase involved in cell wall biosynthesis
VVVPAHNEEQALPRLLDSVLGQELTGVHLEVIVVVNGSADQTAAAARAYVVRFAARGHQLDVVEMATASKACALNEGDGSATSFPRLYLDADILLSPNAIRRTVEELTAVSTPLLAAPRIHVAENAARAVRSYSRIWSRLPYIRSHVPGVGFYAVNEAGRQRWWRFPTRMGADDKFVRLHFSSDETVAIDDASFMVFLPERLSELLRVRGRWTSFNREIAHHCPRLQRHDDSRWISSLRYIATNTSTWPDVGRVGTFASPIGRHRTRLVARYVVAHACAATFPGARIGVNRTERETQAGQDLGARASQPSRSCGDVQLDRSRVPLHRTPP